ncbi:PAS modulated sigma54 specific transcriptional regulator, Fis family (modular protein) [uncultured Desulfobacterium sp.]|uniref:PAS modulated sigma54 specific transcriptional regulator, Fis family (Modular protein) n=1 Tax=uncultured Desulfobacterium sp. TaxID=201089 RepID=A0A445MXA4_9BACT|nr:PAS modulated sigma54 specific transcriptional regulator, Fis family (modular protein) [uncultured Desulfobacterium sp.]
MDKERWERIRIDLLSGETSKREILRREGIHWETLRKILKYPEPPGYRMTRARPKPKIGPYLEQISRIIENDKPLPAGQRNSAMGIYHILKEMGYSGKYTQVKDAVRELKGRKANVLEKRRHLTGKPTNIKVQIGGARSTKGTGMGAQTQKILRDTEDLYRGAFSAAKDGISIVDANGVYLDANLAYCRLLGYSHKEIIGKSPKDSLHPDYRHQLMDEFIPNIKKSGGVRLESVIVRKDGKPVPIEVSGVRFTHAGKPAFLAITRDITERKQAETELIASEERYRFLTDNVADGIMVVQDSKVVFANSACMSMFAYKSSRDVLGISLKDFFHNDLEKKLAGGLMALEKGDEDGNIIQAHCTIEGGRQFWVEARHKFIKWGGNRAVLVALRDVSESKLKQITIEEEREYLFEENLKLRSAMKDRYRFGDIVGRSPAMQEVYDLILRASASDANVAIYGESGTGKELIARTIHIMSSRKNKTFVPVNCGAIPATLFESEFFGHRKGAFTGAQRDKQGFFDISNGGTLFLDEVGELQPDNQVKLLRAIEGGGYTPVGDNKIRNVDVRIICATNRDLSEMIKNGLMREDFFYRIHIIPITIPPLRDRKEDIPLLVERFLKSYNEEMNIASIPGKVFDALNNHDWPGNIRELQNVMQRYVTLGRLDFTAKSARSNVNIEKFSVEPLDEEPGLQATVEAFERQHIKRILEQNQWNRGKTSTYLDIPPKTLYRKMQKYKLFGPRP